MPKNVDIVSEIIGDWGPWQLRNVILIYLCKIPSAWFMACLIFTAPIPKPGEVVCSQPDTQIENITYRKVPETDFCFQSNHASMHNLSYVEDENNRESMPCTSFLFDTPFETTVTKFNLVCSRTILIATSQFFHLFGVLTGGILATKLLVAISPHTLMLHGMVAQIFFGCFAGLVSNYEVHMLMRCLVAASCAQMYTAGQMIFTDITGGKYRTTSICFFETFGSIAITLLPGIAFLDPNYSSIFIMISLPTIAYIPIWWLISDTPRWFLAKGRVEEAADIIGYAVTVNNPKQQMSVPEIRQRLINPASLSVKKETPAKWRSLWTDRRTVVQLIAIHLAWAIYVTNYFGMLLNVKVFGREHLSVNTSALGTSEIVGIFIGYLLIVNCKRKWQYAGAFNIFAGLFASVGHLFPSSMPPEAETGLLMLTAIIPKIAVSCSQAILFTCTTELVTPEMRKVLMFSCVVWARICLLTAPYIGATMEVHLLLPLSVFGLLSAIGGVCTFLIATPRTLEKVKYREKQLPTACVPGKIFMIEMP